MHYGCDPAELKEDPLPGARFADLPRYPQPDGRVKLSAGWMIDRCGWKGRQIGRAGVHDRQALVLVNLGGATGREIYELSQQVATAVQDRFGLLLEREVQVVPRRAYKGS